MGNNITIRPIRNQHSQQVIDLVLPIQQLEFNVNIDLAAQSDLLDIEHYYWQSGGGFWGAFEDDHLVGTIALVGYENAGALRKMFVKKEYRGKEYGIAAALIKELTGFARSKGMIELYLGTVSAMKAAHRFYEKNGFQQVQPEALPVAYPRMPVDDVFYHLGL
ncbi:MAG TPA: GNAT family N-acetyltransferase [Chitinophaga sp.]|uniref:GNAT family N-acetyltransferase n=1 Tax=Chitinophaga sp. TaxID=1869181 RepID=UPI002CFF1BD3|nr:GNAT family N-acetyltransferase [Chitinophaga sp.]HVI49536.1 GNAT family N-acetyltransferase [Chitinophaga sp.]